MGKAAVAFNFGQLDLFAEGMNSSVLATESEISNVLPFPVKEVVQQVQKVYKKQQAKLNQRNFRLQEQSYSNNLHHKCADNIQAIQLLKAIEMSGELATESQKEALVKYTGWGGLPAVFDTTDTCNMPEERDALKAILNEAEHTQARSSVLNAHYTPVKVIKFIWDAVMKMGFKGGKVLDPSTGIGHFIGAMPTELAEVSHIHAVEVDDISVRMTQHLYPDVYIYHQGLEKTNFKRDSFDLVISNIPFGNYRVNDAEYDNMKLSIHNYFFAKSIDLVKAGGLVAFITSRHTLDSNSEHFREYLSGRADLVAAFRLPSCTFRQIANTEVVTDVIFLRKRHVHEGVLSNANWVSSDFSHDLSVSYNKYFHENPMNVLGEMQRVGTHYQRDIQVALPPSELESALRNALAVVPLNVFNPMAELKLEDTDELRIPAPSDVKEGAYAIVGNTLMFNEGGTLVPIEHTLNVTAMKRIKGMIEIRNQLRTLIGLDMQGVESGSARTKLNQIYDQFVSKFGFMWDRANRLAYKGDPDLPMLLALEIYDEENDTCVKSKIFTEVTITQAKLVESFADLETGILVSLNKFARIDTEFIANKMQIEVEKIEEQLSSIDFVYFDPQTQSYVMRDEYLSGNVRQKLFDAMKAAARDDYYKRNVAALEKVAPKELTHEEIRVRLGAPWIPTEAVVQFVAHMLECKDDEVSVQYSNFIASWAIDAKSYWIKNSVNNISTFGTEDMSAIELLEDGLNQRTPTVYDEVELEDGKTKRVVNPGRTEAVRDKLQKIKDAFTQWLWSDDTRKTELVDIYNMRYNSHVNRQYDGSHLQLPGINSAIQLRAHQKNAAWRGLVSDYNLLLAHCVGAGKTMTYCVIAMEGKRIGLFHKPNMVVPNHMLEQFSSEFIRLYPAANILVAGKEDLIGEKRKVMLSRIATGNWDAVIVTHSSFEKLPLSDNYIEIYQDEVTHQLEMAIREQKSSTSSSNTRLVKQIESMKKRAITKIESMKGNKDETISFEQLGIDLLCIDEAHLFKNLMFFTKMNRVAGLPQTASKRAFDMMLKTRFVTSQRHDNKGVVFGTATPISNTIAEMYVMQNYLQNDKLEELGIGMFDNWAANFGETVTSIEVAPDGSGYRMHTRFCRFTNVPELMTIFRSVADIQTKAMLNLPTPALDGGKHVIVASKPSPELKEFVQELVERAEKIRSGQVNVSVDNMLCVTNDGRKAALDMRLIDQSLPEDPECKVVKCVENVFKEWEGGKQQKLTQLVFCDLSTPNAVTFSVYNHIRAKLVEKGVPEDEIAFIHEYDSDAAKAKLFRKVRIGAVRVLLGSTMKLGFGTNVQDRLVAAHHIDAPWRPSDVEQRDGRIERQGNLNEFIRIYRYVTEESFDAYMWQTLETKMRFINQVMSGESNVRDVEDVEMSALSYAEVKAIASGNPMIIEKAGVDAEVVKLGMLKRAHFNDQSNLQFDLSRNTSSQARIKEKIKKIKHDMQQFDEVEDKSNIKIQILGKSYADRLLAGKAMTALITQLQKSDANDLNVGEYRSLAIVANRDFYGIQLSLVGHASYKINNFMTDEGALIVLKNAYNKIPVELENAERALLELQKNKQKIEDAIGKPFIYDERLKNRLIRQREIDTALGIYQDVDGATQMAEEALAA